MALIYIWLLAYVLPALGAVIIVMCVPKWWAGKVSVNLLLIHAALLISIAASQYAVHSSGFAFPWALDSLWTLFYLGAVLSVLWMLGVFGIWYGVSALIQQATMLSIGFLLLQQFSLLAVILLIVPLYALCHLLRVRYGFLTVTLFFLWGAASLFLFSVTQNLWLVAGFHTLLGGVLIQRSVLLPDLQQSKK